MKPEPLFVSSGGSHDEERDASSRRGVPGSRPAVSRSVLQQLRRRVSGVMDFSGEITSR